MMKHERIDEKLTAQMRESVDEYFAGLGEHLMTEAQIMRYIDKKGEAVVKKRIPVMAVAFAMALLLGSVALAAGLGVFGSFTDKEDNEFRAVRLQKLDAVAVQIGQTATVRAPGERKDEAGMTDAQKAINRQAGREYTLTLDQGYCDGHKLYYSYTLKTEPLQTVMGEGMPTGEIEWSFVYPGESIANLWNAEDAQSGIAAWLTEHETAFVATELIGIGDGAWMDGDSLMIFDSDQAWLDGTTLTGYQEVRLPDGYQAGESVDVELNILYDTIFYYQDAEGFREAYVRDPQSRGMISVPVTIPVNGKTSALTGTLERDGATATAGLLVSDVDISGEVVFTGVEGWLKDEATGCVDKKTYAALCEAAGIDGTQVLETWLRNVTLYPGSTDAYVSKVQEALKALGLYDGEITGVLDGKTQQAVKAFQQEHSLGGDPYNWTSDAVRDYELVAGDEVLANLAGGISGIVDGSYSIEVRFDLPQSMENLALRPVGEGNAQRDIPLK